jgi:hypothetical protein
MASFPETNIWIDTYGCRCIRSRTKIGRFRKKRGDTHLSTLEKIYGNISRRRGDTHLESLRKKLRKSLSKMV